MIGCRFQQCLGTVTLVLFGGSSKTGLFRHLSNHVSGVRNVENTEARSVIFFFSKCSKFMIDFKDEAKKSGNFFLYQIIASELLSFNCSYEEQDSQPMCYQAVPRSCRSMRETFPNWISLTVIDEYDNGAVMQISTVLRHVYHVACRRVFWMGTF